jgi:hypothetical protein
MRCRNPVSHPPQRRSYPGITVADSKRRFASSEIKLEQVWQLAQFRVPSRAEQGLMHGAECPHGSDHCRVLAQPLLEAGVVEAYWYSVHSVCGLVWCIPCGEFACLACCAAGMSIAEGLELGNELTYDRTSRVLWRRLRTRDLWDIRECKREGELVVVEVYKHRWSKRKHP